MRVPGTTGHQQHRLVFEFAQGIGDMQRIGHHHQARLLAELRDHRRSRTATVDDDSRMLTNPHNGRASDCLLVSGNRLTEIGHQFLRHGDGAAVTAQQQPIAFERRQILADRNF
ncbi:hypothetical protein D3C87_1819130 [compost metagenome]